MNFKNTLKKNPKLVVIGAGIAGVGAAGKLLTHGFTDIQIVEASSQPGGRIRSCLFGKSTVDEGAQYIHGASMKNPIFQLAKEHGLLQETHDRSDPELSVLTDMQKQMDPDVTKEVKNLASSILRRAHLIAQQKQYTQANSLADVYLEEVKTLVAQWDGDHTDLRRQKLGLLSMLMKWQCVHLAADSLSEVSVHEYEEYNNIEGHDRNSQGLFPDLLQKLLEVIPREKLLLKKPVQQILWNGSFESEDRSLYPVKVVCEDGGHILADHVILTISLATGGPAPPLIRKNYESALEIASGIPPETEAPRPSEAADLYLIRTSMTDRQIEFALCSHAQVLGSKWHRPLSQVPELNEIITENGCLKANGQSLFQPRLPEQKLNAIQSMGFGTMNKIYLEFEAPFWDENTDVIGLVWEEETPLSRQEPNLAEWWKRAPVFYVVRPTERYGHLLVGTISGKEAEFIESLSPQEVASSFTCLFRQFTGRSSLPGLTNVFVTKWFSNPYTRGSYSHISINSTGDMIDLLTEPLPQATEGSGSPTLQVLFAGEATHRSYHSTTHGALLSGWREADRFIDLYSTK